MSTKPVRTYLDPDAVGPLPRASVADDSDALSAARTILRVPGTTNTQEIRPGDVLDVYDPNWRPESLAPTAYDTAGYSVPRTNLARYVFAALAVSGVILVAAAARTFFAGQPSVAEGSRKTNVAAAAAPQAPDTRPTSVLAIPSAASVVAVDHDGHPARRSRGPRSAPDARRRPALGAGGAHPVRPSRRRGRHVGTLARD